MPYAILALVLVALDQLVKFLVVQNIPLGGSVSFIPHVLELTYVKNTGAAFSILNEHTWILTLVSLVLSVVLGLAVCRGFFRHPFGRTALTLLFAGAVGNLIDRVVLHYVVDMFNTLFMTFPVFNVADICVVVGGIAAAIYYGFYSDRVEARLREENGGKA